MTQVYKGPETLRHLSINALMLFPVSRVGRNTFWTFCCLKTDYVQLLLVMTQID